MITPQEIKAKATRSYRTFLRTKVTGESFFPLEIPFGKPAAAVDYLQLKAWVATLLASSKTVVGHGYTVDLTTRSTRRYGTQSLPARIAIAHEADYLRFLGKQREVEQFCAMFEQTQGQVPQLSNWITRYPHRLLENLSIWPELLLVCTYFLHHPRPNCYLRELPLPVHTKFIEEQQAILRQLLDEILPHAAICHEESSFERRFHLRYDEPLIRLRLLDPMLQSTLGWPATDLSLPLSQAAALTLTEKAVLITENKLTFLTLPNLPNTIAIWGQGFQATALRALPWLAACTIRYWGDLDVHGLQILAQVRAAFPQTQSLMMDEATLAAFTPFVVVATPSPQPAPPELTSAEQVLYDHLAANQLRLEQERIDQGYVYRQLFPTNHADL